MIKKILGIVLRIAAALLFLAVGVSVETFSVSKISEKLPGPITMNLITPSGSELIPRSQMIPGTFKIFKTEQEILEKASSVPEKLTVAWGKDGIEYWYSKGDGIFYYAKKEPKLEWDVRLDYWEAERKGNILIFYPKIDYGFSLIILFFFVPIMGGVLGLIGFRLFPWKEIKANKV